MVIKHLIVFKSGEEVELDTDEDIVKQYAMYKTGIDFDAPPMSMTEGSYSSPSQTTRDQPMCFRGVCFVGGFFALDLSEVAFVKRLSEDETIEDETEND